MAHYDNRCSNQLIPYPLPLQTGFVSEMRNSGAILHVTGWELTMRAELVNTTKVQWSAGLNLTIPRTRLSAFPGLATSSYASSLVIGKSTNVLKTYRLSGVDRANGVFQ